MMDDKLLERWQRRAMERFGWSSLPKPKGEWFRASGDCLCTCGIEYRNHPLDPNDLTYDGTPTLHVLCDGRRVKL